MSVFTIAAAQIASFCEEIELNLETHLAAARVAADQGVSLLIFPELSLTGYEPTLAEALAIRIDDDRLDELGELAQANRMTVIVGAPIRNDSSRPVLSSILLHSDGQRSTYGKMHLGGDEATFFQPGSQPRIVTSAGVKTGLAICADSSRESHPEWYCEQGCSVYATSVFLNEEWYAGDETRLEHYAMRYNLLVVMANHANSVGTLTSCGRSTIWLPGGNVGVSCENSHACLLLAAAVSEEWKTLRIEL